METYRFNETMETETISKNKARFKKLIVFCTFCFLSATCLFAGNTATRYYKQVKIVTKDKKEQAGNGGQFITFNDNGCYDSDKSGYDVKNGFSKYNGNDNGYHTYYGSSFWGTATYYFLNDYSRLNIVVEATDITYVYELATPPANVYTCALIKENQPVNSVNPINPVVVNPITPIDGARNKGSGGKYITFTSSSCYDSDKDGYATSKISAMGSCINNTYLYKGKQNDLLIFEWDIYKGCDCQPKGGQYSPYNACMSTINMWLSHSGSSRYEYYYFDSNYERMNEPSKGGSTKVYVKSAAPGEKGSSPSQFY